MAPRSPEARKVLRELRNELQSASQQQGQSLVFSAQEKAVMAQIGSMLDRKHDLLELYRQAEDPKVRGKLSAECRLLEQAAARLLRDIKTDIPAAPSMRTVKARRAARARWDRDAAG